MLKENKTIHHSGLATVSVDVFAHAPFVCFCSIIDYIHRLRMDCPSIGYRMHSWDMAGQHLSLSKVENHSLEPLRRHPGRNPRIFMGITIVSCTDSCRPPPYIDLREVANTSCIAILLHDHEATTNKLMVLALEGLSIDPDSFWLRILMIVGLPRRI